MRGSVEADEESLDHIRDLAWSFDGAGVPRALDQLESGPGMPAATDLGTRPGGWARSISLWSGAAEWDPRAGPTPLLDPYWRSASCASTVPVRSDPDPHARRLKRATGSAGTQ